MHARVSTLQMDPSRLDDAIRQLEENEIPEFKKIDGFKGFTLVVDRDTGKSIATTYWESKETLEASAEAVKPARQRAADTGGASAEPTVEHFEVAVDTMV